jgi:DNA-binding NarL/FixJ family response regulator
MNEFRVLIVEDEPVIAENISIYLNSNDFTVSGIAYDDDEAIYQLRHNTPDAVLLDINLGSAKDGISIAELINLNYHIPFLLLTSYSDRETLERAKMVKPGGYIVKPFHERTLLTSLEIAISNHTFHNNRQLPPLDLEKINQLLLTQLTEREFEVLQLIYEGKTNNQIASALFVSINTIKVHIKNAYLKLNTDSRTTAMVCLRTLMM